MNKRQRSPESIVQTGNLLNDFWANSAGACIEEDFKAGNFITIVVAASKKTKGKFNVRKILNNVKEK